MATLVLASLLLNIFWAFFTQSVNASWGTWWKYLDMDGNGTVDHAVIYLQNGWTQNLTSCTYETWDWIVEESGSINLAITWIDTASGTTVCDGTSNELYLNVSADTGETWRSLSSESEPSITYIDQWTTWSIAVNTWSIDINNLWLEDYANPILTEITPVTTPWYDVTPSYSFNVTEWWDDPDDVTLNWSGSCANYFDTWSMISSWSNTFTSNVDMPYGTYSDCSLQINLNW